MKGSKRVLMQNFGVWYRHLYISFTEISNITNSMTKMCQIIAGKYIQITPKKERKKECSIQRNIALYSNKKILKDHKYKCMYNSSQRTLLRESYTV